jgi:sigma-B regulation protein RsbU (phosphoserine phosphatase)
MLETEMAIAQSIQQSLLPRTSYKGDGIEIAGLSVPATEVGGDYYDIIPLPDDRVAVIIADVSGHGVGAGILSAMTKSALHLSIQSHAEPSAVLNDINNTLFRITEKQMFVTCAYVLYDPASHEVRYATAGHPPFLHHRASVNTLTELRTPNLALGMQHGTHYSEQTALLEPGDALFLFTDGYVEAVNPKGDQFGIEKLKELIYTTSRPSAEKLSASLVASVREFTVTHRLKDDVTMVVMHLY